MESNFWDFNGIDFPWSEFIEESIDLSDEEIQTKFIDVLQLHLNGAHALDSPRGLPFYQQYRYLLQLLSLDANMTIDIHSSSNNAIDHLYYFPHQKEAMPLFLMNYGIMCGEGGYSGNSFNETFLQPWLKLQDLFAASDRKINLDRQSWTLELGNGMDVDAKTVKHGFQGITNYLYHQGILATIPQEPVKDFKTESYLAKNIREYHAIAGGIITDVAPLGTKIKEGEQLYALMTFDKDGSCPREKIVRSLERGVVFDCLSNYSVHQGDCVVSLLT
ncbi:MAG: succinylglutamate desuccinylase [Synechococcaceae cyanobacterium RL_1_2]|nr:succinylglutamate desuccinylase [Synechococcaceae cyanobacterium RL_1_2]